MTTKAQARHRCSVDGVMSRYEIEKPRCRFCGVELKTKNAEPVDGMHLVCARKQREIEADLARWAR